MKKTVNWNIISTWIFGIGFTKERKHFGMDWMIILPFCAIMWQWNSKKHRKAIRDNEVNKIREVIDDQTRIDILADAIDEVSIGGVGLCDAIAIWYNKWMNTDVAPAIVIDKYFPEISKHKPKKTGYSYYWWNIKRVKKRIKVLKKAIKEIELSKTENNV